MLLVLLRGCVIDVVGLRPKPFEPYLLRWMREYYDSGQMKVVEVLYVLSVGSILV